MPASKAEQVLEGIKASLATIPDAVVERNSVLPEKIFDGGLIVLREGDPGEPDRVLGGFGNAYYRSRSTSGKLIRRRVTLPSMLSSSRSGQRSKPTRP